MGQFFSNFYPPKTNWLPDQIPDQTGKVAIVTGGNTGIGFATCRHLLEHNTRVYLAARSPAKAEEAIQHLKDLTKKEDIHFLQLDLADLPTVKKAVDEFRTKEKRLDMLFNSGGVMLPPKSMLTAQGYDLQFGTNTLGHGVFTFFLLPVLLETAKETGDVRVVNTSSVAHDFAPKGGIVWDQVKDGPAREKAWNYWEAYASSKFGNVLFSKDGKELVRRYADEGIVSISLNPGAIRTDLQRYLKSKPVQAWIMDKLLYPLEPYGPLTQLYAGTAPEAKSLSGKYLIPWARVGVEGPDTGDVEQAKKLWALIEEEAGKL
ncbi:NADP-binding protein [Dacryopinax primogenitus]|uniref:NADP-binding protein n=1 Tax=Dacryopinax primogenitus (strain DJM 731) TaxID=1858805 RepID=M5FV18_DACPD|nr:NADP-binding protein [Dacryopinax primogenitus]EJU00099.1 NADP-binding protein [Dacryopinax primogenitus]